MAISMIALDRIFENSIMEVDVFANLLRDNGNWILSDVRKMEDKMIIERINKFGLHIDKKSFSKQIKKYPSAEAYYRLLDSPGNLKLEGKDSDFLWRGLTVLWERWFPEVPNFEMLDDKIDSGYKLAEERKFEKAYNIWKEAWKDILYIMDNHNIEKIEAFDCEFKGTYSISEWGLDFDKAFNILGVCDEKFLERRIDFCSEFIKRSRYKKNKPNIQKLKASIAESYIRLGRQREGDALFNSCLNDDPKWGYGWILWSNCYWTFYGTKQIDYQKAESILKNALTIGELRDRDDVAKRLREFYDETGWEKEEAAIEKMLREYN
ncbi:hypothetical protein ACFIJ5_13705 [Haloimpatiens sp. FM7330]|uniref:hypothetical protein n=1 Tax=Haloimpatiens sp. FM7330 TaxID=3298610 RepID=UPI00362C5552